MTGVMRIRFLFLVFLADWSRLFCTVLCPSSVCLYGCKRVLSKICLKKQTENGLRGFEWSR